MSRTTSTQKEAIRQMVLKGVSYLEMAIRLGMKTRTVRKWGQIVKKGGISIRSKAAQL